MICGQAGSSYLLQLGSGTQKEPRLAATLHTTCTAVLGTTGKIIDITMKDSADRVFSGL